MEEVRRENVSVADSADVDAEPRVRTCAPTFAVSAEIFWGDDRLEEAVNFAVRS
jgi:2-hydroxychromene-2-carboxylate isomerase